jgi:hypothetical protein
MRERIISRVQEFLITHCDPRPEYSGFTAYDFARRIVEMVESESREGQTE